MNTTTQQVHYSTAIPTINYLTRKKFISYKLANRLESVFVNVNAPKVERTISNLKSCCSTIEIHKHENEVEEVKTYKCRNKLCPICQSSRQYRITKNICNFMDAKFNPLRHQLHFLTVTIKNTCNLKKAIKSLSGWSSVTRSKLFPYSGYIKSLEVTVDSSGKYHPHYHILLVREKRKDKKTWSRQEWANRLKKAMKLSYEPVFDIRTIHVSTFNQISSEISKSVSYAHKTSSIFFTKKTSGFSNTNLRTLILGFLNGTYRQRAISKGGKFFKNLVLLASKKQTVNSTHKTSLEKIYLTYNPELNLYLQLSSFILCQKYHVLPNQ